MGDGLARSPRSADGCDCECYSSEPGILCIDGMFSSSTSSQYNSFIVRFHDSSTAA